MNTTPTATQSRFAQFRDLGRKLNDKLRASPLLLIFLLAIVPVLIMNPAKVGLTLFGIAKIGLGGFLGYWIDRLLFPYARPHTLEGVAQGTSWKRRAIIVAAAIIAAALIP
jgi:hypothetical protein